MKTHLLSSQEAKIITQAKTLMAIETLRRSVLVLGLFGCAVMATWTDFHPYYTVKEPSKWDMQALNADNVPAQEEPRAPDALIQEQTETLNKFQVIAVQGPQWEQWFTSVNKALQKGEVAESWRYRLSDDQLHELKRFEQGKAISRPDIRRMVFGQKEEPLASIMAKKQPGDGQEVTLVLNPESASKEALMVYYSKAPALSGLGSSLFGIPEAFSYPLRHLWLPVLAMVLLTYALLPWPQARADICSYKRWQVILGDFGSSLLYGMFMALPLLIVGGAIEAVTTWVFFTAFFWALAALGLCALWWCYFYATYRIHLLENRLIFVAPQGIKSVSFEDIDTIESVRCVPPKWLITLSFLAALSGKGRGNALLLSTSSTGGYCLATKTGDAIYVWVTNSLGQASLTNLNRLNYILEALPCRQLPKLREFEALFPPIIEPIEKKGTRRMVDQGIKESEDTQFQKEGRR